MADKASQVSGFNAQLARKLSQDVLARSRREAIEADRKKLHQEADDEEAWAQNFLWNFCKPAVLKATAEGGNSVVLRIRSSDRAHRICRMLTHLCFCAAYESADDPSPLAGKQRCLSPVPTAPQ